ncbi:hypothetical protein Dde_1156 [Oleidesulfovibrio alaskensis G20]|jgi:endogenous inhibitor of DNA gyrase (YacG/DUF329 family)|uniref:Uncharacterized protein n=1 Tax=Oleidesulfovibrio alaskensis (strain ATCC BAA-1058 / DSM 17464 / G20) TaxID=207559 RepID=Q313D9_OLEA2|nr:hypothetical protein [Oleidesulfovibrio alaskensis]ABB37957.1 hypothetical protein Dde_1156 [Oleidesulfovibrio alaskensis G20]MBG0772895.1 hypothetical protein [Oleidesulfovibrio alaskensis]MBL3582549.1 hypothetical protein [Oleidesulfovibrio alaskensis]
MPVVTCRHCGKEFSVPQARIRAGRGKYCSRRCSDAARTVPREIACAWCGKSVRPTHAGQMYCSRSCGAHAQAARARKGEKRTCAQCGRAFSPASNKERFCSARCRRDNDLQQAATRGYGLFEDPWASGDVQPDRYGKDLYRMPDMGLGF